MKWIDPDSAEAEEFKQSLERVLAVAGNDVTVLYWSPAHKDVPGEWLLAECGAFAEDSRYFPDFIMSLRDLPAPPQKHDVINVPVDNLPTEGAK